MVINIGIIIQFGKGTSGVIGNPAFISLPITYTTTYSIASTCYYTGHYDDTVSYISDSLSGFLMYGGWNGTNVEQQPFSFITMGY